MASEVLLLLLLAINLISTASAALPPRLTRDGIAQIWGFPGVNYKAVNYIPVCGTLSLTNKDEYTYISTVATCDASMSAYNKTAAVSAVYDYTGVISDVEIGTGMPVCLCFSLGGGPGKMDMCMNILSDGTPEGRWTIAYGDIAGGTFISNSDKGLPQCNEVNVPSISSSVYASLGASTSGATPAATNVKVIVTTSGTSIQTFTSTSTASASLVTSNSSGFSKSDQIALGVGLGMVSVHID